MFFSSITVRSPLSSSSSTRVTSFRPGSKQSLTSVKNCRISRRTGFSVAIQRPSSARTCVSNSASCVRHRPVSECIMIRAICRNILLPEVSTTSVWPDERIITRSPFSTNV